jgi:hypothetical protein
MTGTASVISIGLTHLSESDFAAGSQRIGIRCSVSCIAAGNAAGFGIKISEDVG